MRFLAQYAAAPTATVGPVTAVGPGAKLPTGTAGAVKVTIANIPPAVSQLFENPPTFRNLGHITLHTADGPLQALPIEHNPQVFLLPAQVTDITVSPMLPATASVQLLYPSK
jgi:hypothetical protein